MNFTQYALVCAILYARILVVPVVITKETARCALSSETPS